MSSFFHTLTSLITGAVLTVTGTTATPTPVVHTAAVVQTQSQSTPTKTATTTTIIQNITQPVIERTVTTLNTQAITDLNKKISDLSTSLTNKLNTLSSNQSSAVSQSLAPVYQQIALTNRIDTLTGTTITNPIISGATITNSIISSVTFSTETLDVSSTLNVSGLTTLVYASTTQISSTGSSYLATSGGSVGVASTSPWGLFSVNGDNIGNVPQFVVGSSTVTNFTITNNGNVGINRTAPVSLLSVGGNKSATSWTTAGLNFSTIAGTLTDTSGSGTIATRVANSFGTPTFASSNAVTITNAATLYISNAPTAGTNTTITNSQALYVAAGNTYFGGNVGFGTTSPSTRLSITAGTASGARTFAFADSSNNEQMTILDNGNIGIGTTTPAYAIESLGDLSLGGQEMITNGNFSIDNDTVNWSFDGTWTISGGVATGGTGLISQTIRLVKGKRYIVTYDQGLNGVERVYINGSDAICAGGPTGNGIISDPPNCPGGLHNAIPFTYTGATGAATIGFRAYNGGTLDNVSLKSSPQFMVGDLGNNFKVDSYGRVSTGTSTPWGLFSIEVNPKNISYDITNPEFVISSSSITHFVVGVGGKTGIGTTTPWGLLSVNPNALGNAPEFVIGSSTRTHFLVTVAGNVMIGTTTALGPLTLASGAYVTTGGTWTNASDRNLKENFIELDPEAVLTKITELPITQWNYKSESASTTHIGPMAQDFFGLFGLGGSNTSISTIDPAGVALVGVKALVTAVQKISSYFVDGILKIAGISTQNLCISDSDGETCIDRQKLNALLQNANQSSGSSDTGSESSTPDENISTTNLTE